MPFTLLLSLYRAQLWSIFRSQTKERLFPFVYWFPELYISRVVPGFPMISRKAKVAQTEEIHCVYWFRVKYVGRIVPAFPTISRKAKMAQTEEIHFVYWFPVKYLSRIVQAFLTISRKAKIAGNQSAVLCFARFSWPYDTERVKHVIGVMGTPIFFHLSYGTYGTLAYGESVELEGIKLRRDITVFRKCQ